MFDRKNRFILEDYQQKPTFSSFLPGIAGPKGIPAWVYYNNRGQGVCSFGVNDKDHPILEFCPAHTAYQNNERTGFRTFLRINGAYREAFDENCSMAIAASEFEIEWNSPQLRANAVYFGVPGERVAALSRILTLKNITESPLTVELLDGLPALVPYGVDNAALKNMTQLSKAWMQVEEVEQATPFFRVRASMADTARVTPVHGGNFCVGIDDAGRRLPVIADPGLLFGEDTALKGAALFAQAGLAALLEKPQVTQNQFPCCFLAACRTLAPGETMQVLSVYGQAENKTVWQNFVARVGGADWFEAKRKEAAALTQALTDAVDTRTADPVFDAYCRQTYLDNLLRGGVPMFFRAGGRSAPFYLYSRKHGDPEREYNAFSLGSEYYAQGNGNFRDVNQNRRSDVLFYPELGDAGIRSFYELLQSDGYNPLVITASTFQMEAAAAEAVCAALPQSARAEIQRLLTQSFTPGRLAMQLEGCGLSEERQAAFLAECICSAANDPNADFGEGYWCDHWTYHLDLIDRYLAVFPENKEALLFGPRDLRWYETRAFVNPRSKRYLLTGDGLRQYHALDEKRKAKTPRRWLHTAQGETARSSLMEKIVVLCALKTATLDAAGMGIEMEGGKPGWYDALNGLPGLLGSSMAESCELARLLAFARQALTECGGALTLYTEMAQLLTDVDAALAQSSDPWARWNAANEAKERYRELTAEQLSGSCTEMSRKTIAAMLGRFETAVREGIQKAVALGGGICPTYFTFTAEGTRPAQGGILPTGLMPHPLPLFLEGPVHWLKLGLPRAEKQRAAEAVCRSGLYDQKLKMYKVNESLASVSFEAGRAKAFTPGWLENESIWLHMEYKYLLELLKNGLYEQFGRAFRDAAVPFLDVSVYGRSPLENVSFIASSANPNPAMHGRGFVARLSGSTAEFLDIWQRMFFGNTPFTLKDGALRLQFEPYLPAYLMPKDGLVRATFRGDVPVTYRAEGKAELIPGEYRVAAWALTDLPGRVQTFAGPSLPTSAARQVRSGQIRAIELTLL